MTSQKVKRAEEQVIKTGKRAATHRSRKTKLPSVAAVRAAAFECETQEQAEARLGCDVETLAKKKVLAAAWERGRFLRLVSQAAAETFVVPERVGREVGLARGEFAEIYRKDRAVRDLWDREQAKLFRSLKAPLVARAKEGDPKAVAAVEALFCRDDRVPVVDFERMAPVEIARAVGIDHRTLGRWAKEHDLPRAADGSYSLPRLVAWLRDWEVRKLAAQKAGVKVDGETALERLRRLQGDEIEQRVFQRQDVVAMLRSRAAWLVQLLSPARAEQWAHEHEGKTSAQLKIAYVTAFETLLRRWCDWPAELPMPEAARQKFEEGLQLLVAEGAESAG